MPISALTDADWAQALADHPKLVVKYYADWCGQCRLIAPKFTRLADEHPGLTFVEVNAEHSPTARKAAGVDNLPFFAVFQNGQLVAGEATGKIERVQELVSRLN